MSGPLRLLPGEGDSLPAIPRSHPRTRARPGWAKDPIDELAERLVEQVSGAVHPYEVAALLESDGMTGDRIRDHYGRAGLFALAEDLYHRVPRHYPEPAPSPDPWKPDHWRCALRGLVFALPGLGYVLGADLWRGTPDVTGLIAAALVAWAWNQALSHRAYLRLAAEGPAGAGRALRSGAPAGAMAATAVGLLVSGPGTAAAFAAGQSCYVAAATVLLVLGRERTLALTLLPVAAGAVCLLWWRTPVAVSSGLLLVTVALAALAAGHAIRGTLRAAPSGGGTLPALRDSLPYGLFGLAAGALTMSGGDGTAGARGIVVLTLSMGFAEWLLYRYRGMAVAALRASATVAGFTLRAGRALAMCLAAYTALLLAGALAVGADAVALPALGALLWTGLLLQAFALARPPALVCLAAAVASAAGRPYGIDPLVCPAAAAVLFSWAWRHLGRPSAHR
ncbi:hypothetical protein J7E96_13510 [Streptomyces sp. ISL-96]|uniref:hypothetical protein n=1 Tax=Streptomyces sp. ISL-96 TaxID=2819191 RepID=UPI001BE983FF|nr:hypothetical protein [Streptomyces sp. ISL-96]MBT2489515.1 hypothetical protein [Streptomyces sp. ISL-96]